MNNPDEDNKKKEGRVNWLYYFILLFYTNFFRFTTEHNTSALKVTESVEVTVTDFL